MAEWRERSHAHMTRCPINAPTYWQTRPSPDHAHYTLLYSCEPPITLYVLPAAPRGRGSDHPDMVAAAVAKGGDHASVRLLTDPQNEKNTGSDSGHAPMAWRLTHHWCSLDHCVDPARCSLSRSTLATRLFTTTRWLRSSASARDRSKVRVTLQHVTRSNACTNGRCMHVARTAHLHLCT
jgi:hypothetical protein